MSTENNGSGTIFNSDLGYGPIGPTEASFQFDGSEQWTRPFNPTVVNVFAGHCAVEGSKLFGVVGDLDNLGHYVAHSGRPAAENLVDLYNQQIRNIVHSWATANDDALTALTFVPSGEEVLILGSTTDVLTAETFTARLREKTMAYMSMQRILPIGETAASFGCETFGNTYDTAIRKLLNAISEKQDEEVIARHYFSLMASLRTDMANRLDEQKFGKVLPEVAGAGVALRRLAWTGMMRYKRQTRWAIEQLNKLFEDGDPATVAQIVAFLDQLGTWQPGIPTDSGPIVAGHMAALGLQDTRGHNP